MSAYAKALEAKHLAWINQNEGFEVEDFAKKFGYLRLQSAQERLRNLKRKHNLDIDTKKRTRKNAVVVTKRKADTAPIIRLTRRAVFTPSGYHAISKDQHNTVKDFLFRKCKLEAAVGGVWVFIAPTSSFSIDNFIS